MPNPRSYSSSDTTGSQRANPSPPPVQPEDTWKLLSDRGKREAVMAALLTGSPPLHPGTLRALGATAEQVLDVMSDSSFTELYEEKTLQVEAVARLWARLAKAHMITQLAVTGNPKDNAKIVTDYAPGAQEEGGGGDPELSIQQALDVIELNAWKLKAKGE